MFGSKLTNLKKFLFKIPNQSIVNFDDSQSDSENSQEESESGFLLLPDSLTFKMEHLVIC